MPLHTILIKPASGYCNMRCDYCFYCDEMVNREQAFRGMMSETTLRNLIKKAMRQAGNEICFAFQGGEIAIGGMCSDRNDGALTRCERVGGSCPKI